MTSASTSFVAKATHGQRFMQASAAMFSVLRDYKFLPATSEDYDLLMRLMHGFFRDEPHARAYGVMPRRMEPLGDFVMQKALPQNYSIKVLHEPTNEVVGFRMMAVANRNPDADPVKVDKLVCFPETVPLVRLLQRTREKVWELCPDVDKLLCREMTYIAPKHQRKGIAQHLLHYSLDFASLRADGVRGITTEASSIANQRLLEKNGYRLLWDIQKEEPQRYLREDGSALQLDDGTTGIQLRYLDLGKTR